MYKLRGYQQEAVQSTLKHFRHERTPAVIVLPTGAGKSLVIAELARVARGRVLVMAHVKELVEQNYEKYKSHALDAGIFSAGLQRKDSFQKTIFGSIQSIARAPEDFFKDFSLVVIDECHRISTESDTQYQYVIDQLKLHNPTLCILGLTATPYRLGYGWIYEYNQHLKTRMTTQPRFFKKCIYELTTRYMIEHGYLTPPIQIDSPVASYDFSDLQLKDAHFVSSEIEKILKDQKRITPLILKNIQEMAKDRQGVIIFTSTVKHAHEIMENLPKQQAAMVVGSTEDRARDAIIQGFKNKEIKYLVNVSVLTTGFDAPHVDVIAILRPTESVSLYQQIIGRGLRLSPGKTDCLVLDYTGQSHDIFTPEISEAKPNKESVIVEVPCPQCGITNHFWGLKDEDDQIIEHYGRRCHGAFEEPHNGKIQDCGFLFRYKLCDKCAAENDISAHVCVKCAHLLIDTDKKLKETMSLKDAHVLKVDSVTFEKTYDKKGLERLTIKYYDADANKLTEHFYLHSSETQTAFYFNFVRMHNRRPEVKLHFENVDQAIDAKDKFRTPVFVIARKKDKYWNVREKIFEI